MKLTRLTLKACNCGDHEQQAQKTILTSLAGKEVKHDNR
jgi:hypothetical protein